MYGSLALVGSGEYLPAMAALEKSLIDDAVANGKTPTYIQIPTAAGRESAEKLDYWKELGQAQAQRLGVNSIFYLSTHVKMHLSKSISMRFITVLLCICQVEIHTISLQL